MEFLEFGNSDSTRKTASPSKATLSVNVWPRGEYTPEGQVEIYTSRGDSVSMTLPDFEKMVERIREGAKGKDGRYQ